MIAVPTIMSPKLFSASEKDALNILGNCKTLGAYGIFIPALHAPKDILSTCYMVMIACGMVFINISIGFFHVIAMWELHFAAMPTSTTMEIFSTTRKRKWTMKAC